MAEIAVCRVMAGRQKDGLAVGRLRRVQLAQCLKGDAKIVVVVGVAWARGDRLLKKLSRKFVAPGLVCERA